MNDMTFVGIILFDLFGYSHDVLEYVFMSDAQYWMCIELSASIEGYMAYGNVFRQRIELNPWMTWILIFPLSLVSVNKPIKNVYAPHMCIFKYVLNRYLILFRILNIAGTSFPKYFIEKCVFYIIVVHYFITIALCDK